MPEEKSSVSLINWVLGLFAPILIILLGFAAIAAMGTSGAKKSSPDGDDPLSRLARFSVVTVEPTQPFLENLSLDIESSGFVVPFRQITIAAEVAGRIKSKSENCQLGRYVKAGDTLFVLDKTDYESEVERLTAMRESEYAQQKELDQEVANAQRALKLSEEEVALQEREIKRVENLPKGFASGTELDQARRARLGSVNQRLTIQNQLEMLATKRTRILLAERLATTQLTQAKVNLARTEIKAPISGVIVSESVEADSYVQKGATLCVIDDTQRVEVSCNLRPDQLTFVLDQDSIHEELSSENGYSYQLPKTPVTVVYKVTGREETVYEWQGHLSRYEGIGLDPQSRTVPVRITVDNPRDVTRNGKLLTKETGGSPPALVRGMFVNCVIRTNPKRELLLLPKLALQPGNQVWLFEKDETLLTAPSQSKPIEVAQEKSAEGSGAKLRLEDWIAGRLRIVRDVKVIRPYRSSDASSRDFWIVEAREDLKSEMLSITSPLSAIQGDGTDKIRRASDAGASK